MGHSGRVALSWIAIALTLAVVGAAQPTTTVRVFEVDSSTLSWPDAVSAIEPLLSVRGSLTLQPRQQRLTVQDTPEVVARVVATWSKLTRKDEHYRVRVVLLEGTDNPLPRGETAVVDPHVRRKVPFKNFRQIGETEFAGRVGETAQGSLGGSFGLAFRTNHMAPPTDVAWGLRDLGGRLSLDPVTLVKNQHKEEGEQQQLEVLRTSVVLGRGQRAIFGIYASANADHGLVLVLEALATGID